jgi:hypothetical protein
MKEYLKEYWKEILLAIAVGGIVYPFVPIYSTISISILIVIFYKQFIPDAKNLDDDNTVENLLLEADGVILEQEEVIREYENILDSLSTTLPCNCGGNTFQGLFQPGMENIVECDKCGSKYKVMVSFDSILMTDPMDLDRTSSEITNKIQNEKNR